MDETDDEKDIVDENDDKETMHYGSEQPDIPAFCHSLSHMLKSKGVNK